MKVYGLTDSGICRAENQDAYAAYRIAWRRRRHLFHSRLEGEVQHQMLGCSFEGAFGRETLEASPLMPNEEGVEEAVIAVVCDGMGGVLGGEIASRLATEAFVKGLSEGYTGEADVSLGQALQAANDAVYYRAEEDRALHGMGTTVVAAVADGREIALLHVGDSRAYLFHDGEVLLLTHDHSYVQELVDAGSITEAEARRHAKKNLITRAVGVGRSVEADLLRVPWSEGDRLLLCTDGLSNYIDERELLAIFSDSADLCIIAHELIGAANCKGGEDNITALLLENVKENRKND